MVILIDALRFTRIDGSVYGHKKILPTSIARYRLQFASKQNLNLLLGIIAFYMSDNTVE